MSMQSPERTIKTTATEPTVVHRPSRLVTIVAILAFVVGGFSVLGGLGGAVYTFQQAATENITTPGDAAIADTPVRGPLTMWAQADIITEHQLDTTEGQRFAEMDREDPARASWFNATTLTTALSLGIISYAFSAFAIAMGAMMILFGLVLLRLRHAAATA